MASTYLSFTQGAATSRRIFTISVWVKRANLSAQQQIFETWLDNNNRFDVQFTASDKILVQHTLGGSTSINIETSRLFRDTSAWYHIVVEVDTTQATASDRVKIYINGSQETSLSPATYPSQNLDLALGTASYTNFLGKYSSAGGNYFDGSMSHFHFTDGYAYDASAFGQYDANGVWTIKTSPSVTYGTNGFFILKDGNSVTDQSGNGNNFTVAGGTLTNTEDNPSNVFCTLNPLSCNGPLEDGNTTFAGVSGSTTTAKGTLGVTEGKWYFEAKVSSDYPMIGIGSMNEAIMQNPTGGGYPGGISNSYGIYGNGAVYANGSNTGNQGFTYTTNDIIGVALDLDSATKTIVWYKNGSQIATYNLTNTGSDYPFTPFTYNGGETATANFNFGNGYFGTTAVASAGTNASGNGIFEYDVPTGYTALSTKGLNL